MPRHLTVDRDSEVRAFVTLLQAPSRDVGSILLIQETSGQGKSRLLECYAEHCREYKIPVAHIDLKNSTLSPVDILWSIQRDFHPLPLPRCNQTLQSPRIALPSFQLSDNKSLGQTSYTLQSNINVAGLSRDEQKQWWASSAQSFAEDIIEHTRSPRTKFVILFDTYEKANPGTRAWIADHILRIATPNRVSSLVIVLAGKQVPETAGEWAPHCLRECFLNRSFALFLGESCDLRLKPAKP